MVQYAQELGLSMPREPGNLSQGNSSYSKNHGDASKNQGGNYRTSQVVNCMPFFHLCFIMSGSNKRGFAVIINNEKFLWSSGMNDRKGSNIDCTTLEKLFKKLNFTVNVHKDVTSDKMLEIVEGMALHDHKASDCYVMAFLSHGDDGVIYGVDGEVVEIKTMSASFRGEKCPSLIGKPKIFIFQACRGATHEEPVSLPEDCVDSIVDNNELVVDHAVKPTIPSGADFLFCYSVTEGFYSLRDTLYGSWYIQSLVRVFEEELIKKGPDHARQVSILDLLTIVNDVVSKKTTQKTKDVAGRGKKQMPCFLSMLTKKFYLAPSK